MCLLCPTLVRALYMRRALNRSSLGSGPAHRQQLPLLPCPGPPSCLVPPVVVYTPVLPRPFAPVCEMWTLPSGRQVTETCGALQSVKTQSVHGTVSRWDGPATCNTSQGGAQGETNGCF